MRLGERPSSLAALALPPTVFPPTAPLYGRHAAFYQGWMRLPDRDSYRTAFRGQWEPFLKHCREDTPFPWDLLEDAKGAQLTVLG